MELKSKREAAEMLGLSTRGIERAVRRGHLTVLYRDSKHGKQAWFKAPELERLKQHHGQVGFTTGIPPRPETPGTPAVGTLVPMVEIPSRDKRKEHEDQLGVPIADRLTLTVEDAAQLSGLPRSFIEENIHSEKLKAIMIGRRHFIKRADLNEFVDKL